MSIASDFEPGAHHDGPECAPVADVEHFLDAAVNAARLDHSSENAREVPGIERVDTDEATGFAEAAMAQSDKCCPCANRPEISIGLACP